MAAPNIVGVTTITAKTTYLTLVDANETTLLTNSSNSNKVFKVNTIMIANIDGTNAADISITIYTAATGGTGHKIANTISVPADSSLVALDKSSSIYLEEDKRITVQASAANDLAVVCSYEEIS
jgi:hypothetical protein